MVVIFNISDLYKHELCNDYKQRRENNMKKDSEYVNQLKKLIFQLQAKESRADLNIKDQVVKAAKWKCPDKTEKKMLNDLINRAVEYIQLEQMVKEQNCTKDEAEKYFSYLRWFSSIKMILETFDVTLKNVSFTDLSLNESS